MDGHEERGQADAAQDADSTQFITVDRIPDASPGPRRVGLLLAVALGILAGLALLAAVAFIHRGHSAPARAETRPGARSSETLPPFACL